MMSVRGQPEARRIAFVIAHLGPGGSQRVLVNVANALAEHGHETHVVTVGGDCPDVYELSPAVRRHRLSDPVQGEAHDRCSRKSYRLAMGGGGLHVAPAGAADAGPFRGWPRRLGSIQRFLRTVAMLRGKLKAIEPEVVVSLITLTNMMTILATRGLALKTVISERNDPRLQKPEPALQVLRRLTYPLADIITANTTEALSALGALAPKSKLAYLPNPLQVSGSRMVIRYSAPTYVCVGRLVHQKGIDLLLKSSALAFTALPDWRLAIIGDGPLRSELQGLALSLGIADRVDWLGQVDDPFPYLKAAQFFVSASRFEGTPNALLEALSCSLPAIVTDASPGPLELIGHGEAGLVVPAGDIEIGAAAIIRLAKDSALRRSLASMAAARVHAHRPEQAMQAWHDVIQFA